MRKDIDFPEVKDVGVAVVEDKGEEGKKIYNVYLINISNEIIEEVLITSTGYGVDPKTKEKKKTSTLRHRIAVLASNQAAKIEPIMEDLFSLTNEYFISFWIGNKMYDKKFIFVPESIREENMIELSVLEGKRGVLII